MIKLRMAILALAAGMLMSAPAMATKAGFYIGGSVGGASTEYEDSGIKVDDDDTAWKLFAGYHFLQFFAVEASYRDLGEIGGSNASVDLTAYDVSGLVGLPLGPVYLYGRFGALWWDADLNGFNRSSDDGAGYLGGIGASIDFFKIQLRAEAEYLDAADGSIMYTVGGAWRF